MDHRQYPLILGASGLTGTEVIKQLTAKNINVRVTYREPADLNLLRHYGVEPFYADFAQPETMRNAMVGVDRVATILPIDPSFGEWGKIAIDSACDAGVRRFVALSNFSVGRGAKAEIAYMHGEIEEHLKKSGLDYTIIRPSTYFQNMLWTTITIMREKRFSLPMENAKIPHIDMRDVAEALIATLLDDEQHIGKTYTITGDRAMSMFDVAHLLSDVLGEKIRYYPTPLESARESFRDLGMVEWIARTVSEMYKDYAALDLAAVSDDFQAICERPPRTFDSFLREYASVFANSETNAIPANEVSVEY